jgi:hypothetical protein
MYAKKLFIVVSLIILFYGALARGDDEHAVTKINEDGTMTITLTKEQADICHKDGCTVLPTNILREVIRESIVQACGKEI